MAEILGAEIPIDLPSFGFGFGSTIWFFIILIIVILGFGITAIIFMNRFRVYNKKIVVFENISGQGFQPVYKDRAKLVKLGDGGEELLYLLKKKVYRTAYGKKMGKNVYWFAVGQDGYWYNVILGDVDAKMGMLDIEPIDRDMRYMHVAIRRNITDRYKNKLGFMDKYGAWVLSGVVIIVLMIGMWFMFDKIADMNAVSAEAVKVAAEVQKETGKLVAALDNLYGGSGLRPIET